MIINVNLKERSYPIYINEKNNIQTIMQNKFGNRKKVLVTNTTIMSLYSQMLNKWKEDFINDIIVIDDGEEYKTLDTWQYILNNLLEKRYDRTTVLSAFGGGVVGDITGFAAASFLRGISYVQIPTTLLAMVDSSVGGKTAVNHPMGKNLIGAFYQPSFVWIDTQFLKTLPEKEFFAGYGEIFKYAFIGGKKMFEFIKENHHYIINKSEQQLTEAIKRSVEIKADIVSKDEKESGLRALLNFGHTFAHSLEKYFNYKTILHGEAVIWGIFCAVNLGKKAQITNKKYYDEFDKILYLLVPSKLTNQPDINKLYENMFSDKKVKQGNIRFVLPKSPGISVITSNIKEDDVLDTLKEVFEK